MNRLHWIAFRVEPQGFQWNETVAWDVLNLYVDGALLQDLVAWWSGPSP